MQLKSINTGYFKLDGGAMFGTVPKVIWNKLNPADQNNLCTWAMRCLFVEDGNKRILIDTGIGDKQSSKFFSYYYLHGDDSLKKSLHTIGVDFKDITDIIFTHLHFDHCGGALRWNSGKTLLEPVFPNAKYWVHQKHWEHALHSNPREGASFLDENIHPLELSGQLHFVSDTNKFTENISFLTADGHTEKMILPKIKFQDKTLVFCADLIPSSAHIPINYVMGYDIRPLVRMKECKSFLEEAIQEDWTLFFEHDPLYVCGKAKNTDKGPRLDTTFSLDDFISSAK